MAMKKCKECGEEISTKAKACPKCGAVAPKKTSLFTWIILIFIIFIVYAVSQTPSTSTRSSSSKSSSSQSSSIVKAKAQKPTWNTTESKDKMSGKKSSYALSPTITPVKKMKFPYNSVTASVGVGCDKDSEWAYFNFSQSPNLTGEETKDGYNVISTRIKWGKESEHVTLIQTWGAPSLHFRDKKYAISKIIASNSILLELDWHGSPGTYFEFPLRGSSAALKKIRASCSKY